MRIGIVGATGAVGQEIIALLNERRFGIESIKLFASPKSAGKKIKYLKKNLVIEKIKKNSFTDLDIVFFSAGSSISKKYAEIAKKNGCYVIDNSSAFRLNKNVPLIVPEINNEALNINKKIISNPNCTTIISLMAVKPLMDLCEIKRVVATSFQSVSGAGNTGIDELIRDTKAAIQKKKFKNKVFDRNIAFNVIPKIGDFEPNLFTQEEMKLQNESRKILSNKKINLTATTVRVPVLRSHSISLNIEFIKKVNLKNIINALKKFKGIRVHDDLDPNLYPTPHDSSNIDDCIAGRIRVDYSQKNTVSLWVVGDQIRKGAALNAVQIAEALRDKIR
jgi:aspartate-semialdehyde dehydrogenase|tara:strand:+ start:423 stop:1424 length:1002 start_codon:yes stop_codon:yes gene_type:complete